MAQQWRGARSSGALGRPYQPCQPRALVLVVCCSGPPGVTQVPVLPSGGELRQLIHDEAPSGASSWLLLPCPDRFGQIEPLQPPSSAVISTAWQCNWRGERNLVVVLPAVVVVIIVAFVVTIVVAAILDQRHGDGIEGDATEIACLTVELQQR